MKGIYCKWTESKDDQALTGHVDYAIQLSSDQILLNLETHANELIIKSLPKDNYSLKLAAFDPLG
jgi:hypothetical protein